MADRCALDVPGVVESPFSAVRLCTDAARRYKKIANAESLTRKIQSPPAQRLRPAGLPERLVPTMWKPGESANPGGVALATREVARLAREYSPAAVQTLAQIMLNPKERTRDRAYAAVNAAQPTHLSSSEWKRIAEADIEDQY